MPEDEGQLSPEEKLLRVIQGGKGGEKGEKPPPARSVPEAAFTATPMAGLIQDEPELDAVAEEATVAAFAGVAEEPDGLTVETVAAAPKAAATLVADGTGNAEPAEFVPGVVAAAPVAWHSGGG